MEEEIIDLPQADAAVEVVDIQFRPGQKVYYFDPAGIACSAGDHVIIDTARGPEYGICASGNHTIPQKDIVAPLRSVLRIATEQDEKVVAENRAKEKKAYDICLQKIRDHNLDMQLVSAEYAFDGSKILFFFTADERVDFRELVKNLASIFHTRIELRQIGVRDKAKMVGGLGICGRPFCCSCFLDEFHPVSIKMAKTQNLSLNPTKISGTCGRLMCCLKYEQEAYEDLIRSSPKLESFIDTPEGRGTVIELDLLRQRVKVRMEEAPETISIFSNSEIAVLRNGKAKKNDPPIPADLAPISGSGKRVKKEDESSERMFLDPIKFRYSTEAVVDEPETAAPAEETAEEAGEAKAIRRRRGSRRNKQGDSAEKTAEVKKEQESKPKNQESKKKHKDTPKEKNTENADQTVQQEGQPKKQGGHHRRKPYYHRRKSKQNGGSASQE